MQQSSTKCHHCGLANICLPQGLNKSQLQLIDEMVKRRRFIEKGGYLFKEGERFTSIYATFTGAFKTFFLNKAGEEHITAYALPGDLLGFEAIYPTRYTASAVALSDSAVCEIEFQHLLKLASKIPELQRQVFMLMGQRICHADEKQLHLTAQKKLVRFLLDYQQRLANTNQHSNAFTLIFSRRELADYLGLSHETISRELLKLKNLGLLETKNRHITLLKQPALKAIAQIK